MGIRLPVVCLWGLIVATAAPIPDGEWPAYGRDPGGAKYSPLSQINRENVQNLKVAWTYRTGDMYDPAAPGPNLKAHGGRKSALEATPLFVNGMLYLSTPFGRVIALNPETGARQWSYDPESDITAGYGDFTSRGVSFWADPARKTGQNCGQRIFVATIDARLIAVDANSGKPCRDFGTDGQIDLRSGLRNPPQSKSEYEQTSPPAIIAGLVVVGSAIADNTRANAPSGEVRAFDARTGKLRWTWDPTPAPTGGANAWSIISADPERNLIFVPTSCPSPDYYGGKRPGNNLYANSVVALRAQTGKVVWHFQTVHHDLWDYDVASQPTLIEIKRNGRTIPAVAAGSKTGHLFLLHRETGKPLFPVEERPVPKSAAPGEEAWPTQPFPTLPAALVPQKLRPEDAWGLREEDRQWCRERIGKLRSEGIFTPPSLEGSLVIPGNIGGLAWGGTAFDPRRGLLIVPTNNLPAVVRLIPRADYEAELKAHPEMEIAPQSGTPYAMGRIFLRSPSGAPCNAPPWGSLTVIDSGTGSVRWSVPLGFIPFMSQVPGYEKWGSPNLGGPIVTGGDLAFIGASFDPHLRAFDVETGAELWKGEMPTSARATPMTYRAANGKQYVVISAGGHDVPGGKQGDYVVAFSLP